MQEEGWDERKVTIALKPRELIRSINCSVSGDWICISIQESIAPGNMMQQTLATVDVTVT